MRETERALPASFAGTALARIERTQTKTMRRPGSFLTTTFRSRALPFVAALGLLVLGAALIGARDGGPIEAASEPAASNLEQRVMALIAERHPGASILAVPTFAAMVQQIAREADLDFRLVLAIVEHESEFHPDRVGASGEIGLMQILPATAESVARALGMPFTPPTVDRKGRYTALGSLGDPAFNLRVGTAYLLSQVKRYGLNATALRAYNRNPERAREHWPDDRYAEEIGLRYVSLAHALRE